MENKNITIIIPLERHEELVDLETRAQLLMEYTQHTKLAVDRAKVAHYMGFRLNKKEI